MSLVEVRDGRFRHADEPRSAGREMLMAAALGTGPIADAFNAAFQFPNTFRRLFAEGAFNAAFVPLFAKEIEAHGTDGAKRFRRGVRRAVHAAGADHRHGTGDAAAGALPGGAGLSGDSPGKFEMTVGLATIMFPYLICMSLGAMMSRMLNSLRRYFAAAVAPVFLNVILIGVLACAWHKDRTRAPSACATARGVLAAGWCNWRSSGWRGAPCRHLDRLSPAKDDAQCQAAADPGAAGGGIGGITQINQLIGTAIASAQDSAVSSLAYADRIYQQLPLGVVGIAVAIVLLPELSRAEVRAI